MSAVDWFLKSALKYVFLQFQRNPLIIWWFIKPLLCNLISYNLRWGRVSTAIQLGIVQPTRSYTQPRFCQLQHGMFPSGIKHKLTLAGYIFLFIWLRNIRKHIPETVLERDFWQELEKRVFPSGLGPEVSKDTWAKVLWISIRLKWNRKSWFRTIYKEVNPTYFCHNMHSIAGKSKSCSKKF